jgi:non-homologous end joining protein Ku
VRRARHFLAAEVEEPPTNVVDLRAALRKSLDAASAAKKQPAKAVLPIKKAVAKAEPKRKRA